MNSDVVESSTYGMHWWCIALCQVDRQIYIKVASTWWWLNNPVTNSHLWFQERSLSIPGCNPCTFCFITIIHVIIYIYIYIYIFIYLFIWNLADIFLKKTYIYIYIYIHICKRCKNETHRFKEIFSQLCYHLVPCPLLMNHTKRFVPASIQPATIYII